MAATVKTIFSDPPVLCGKNIFWKKRVFRSWFREKIALCLLRCIKFKKCFLKKDFQKINRSLWFWKKCRRNAQCAIVQHRTGRIFDTASEHVEKNAQTRRAVRRTLTGGAVL